MEELTHHPPINKNCQEQSRSGVSEEKSESPPPQKKEKPRPPSDELSQTPGGVL